MKYLLSILCLFVLSCSEQQREEVVERYGSGINKEINAKYIKLAKARNNMCPIQIGKYTKMTSVEYSKLILTYNYQIDEEGFRKSIKGTGFEEFTYTKIMEASNVINDMLKEQCSSTDILADLRNDRITYLYHYYNFDGKLIHNAKLDASVCEEF